MKKFVVAAALGAAVLASGCKTVYEQDPDNAEVQRPVATYRMGTFTTNYEAGIVTVNNALRSTCKKCKLFVQEDESRYTGNGYDYTILSRTEKEGEVKISVSIRKAEGRKKMSEVSIRFGKLGDEKRSRALAKEISNEIPKVEGFIENTGGSFESAI